MRFATVAATAALLVATAVSAVEPKGCVGKVNPFPVNTDAPVWVKNVTNGIKYTAGLGGDQFNVLHVYGTPYEQGFAQGQMIDAAKFDSMWEAFLAYVATEVEANVHFLSPKIIQAVIDKGLPFALNLTIAETIKHTPAKYLDEMKGLADGAGVPYLKVYQLNMFPELIRAACTIVGATKSGTANGQIAHLRDLDFGVDNPLRDYPQVTVYHNTNGTASFANFGWSYLVGSLTGFGENGVGIGEKVWDNSPKGAYGSNGTPWMFILRDVLLTTTIDEALAVISTAERTCAIHAGIGSTHDNEFRGVDMAHNFYGAYDWNSTSYEVDTEYHPVLQDVFYWDKHVQPSHHYCLGSLLKMYHGKISAEVLATEVSGLGETGDFHSVAFDYANKIAFFSNTRKTNGTGPITAYNRQYTRVNIGDLFAVEAPVL